MKKLIKGDSRITNAPGKVNFFLRYSILAAEKFSGFIVYFGYMYKVFNYIFVDAPNEYEIFVFKLSVDH
ncbi:MAG: hypothetical protein ABIN67_09715 [Ferruginibacter sp.]